MQFLYTPVHALHSPDFETLYGKVLQYPDKPERIESLHKSIIQNKHVELYELYEQEFISLDEINHVHDIGMLKYFKETSENIEKILNDNDLTRKIDKFFLKQEYFFPFVFPSRSFMHRIQHSESGHPGYYCFDTEGPIGKGTLSAILASATLADKGAELILQGSECVYSLCRPSGHHAGTDFYGGYCYINNAALAAYKLLQLGRVAIIDIDYHHGNGTQEIFWANENVLYASIHADPRVEYPYYSGYRDEVGAPGTNGTNINVPLAKGTGEEEYLQNLIDLLSKINDFGTSCLIVSIGYDTHKDDPLGYFTLTTESFMKIGKLLKSLNVPLLYVQEGGYNVSILGKLVEAVIKGSIYQV